MKNNQRILSIICFVFLFALIAFNVFASQAEGADEGIVEKTSLLVLQLSVILFAAWLGRVAFLKLKLPQVLGEIMAGVVIGPYALGQIHFPGFSHGIFPLAGEFPVSIELYSIATIASIILLFLVGLETDIVTFIKYSAAGSMVGILGVVFSFAAGDYVGIILSERLLGEEPRISSSYSFIYGCNFNSYFCRDYCAYFIGEEEDEFSEGVTILAAAVIDDVLGIIILAVVLGMVKHGGHIGVSEVSWITFKAVSIWLGFTFLGIRFAHRISGVLKKFRDKTMIAIMSFGMALLLAGIFEKSGLAMIIGAYVMGLSFSKTDLSFIIQEKVEVLQKFFVPIFFCVMGMLINLKVMASYEIMSFGLIYLFFAVVGKIVGCSLPALFLNFNMRGALRVGVGMVPRGEVALIMAGIGLSTGIIDDKIFSVVMIMTFLTTLITPPILDKMLSVDKPVLRKEQENDSAHKTLRFAMPSADTADLLLNKVVSAFENEGFYVSRMPGRVRYYQIRKEEVFIILKCSDAHMTFDCIERDEGFIHTVFYEVIADLEHVMKNLQTLADKKQIGEKIFKKENDEGVQMKKFHIHTSSAVEANLKGVNKQEIIEEMVGLLILSEQLDPLKKDTVLRDLIDREETMSTGMQDGIALPHAKTNAVDHVVAVVGIKKEGIDFSSLDGQPAKIFVLTLASKENPHAYLQSMAEISRFLAENENRDRLLSCDTNDQLFEVLS